MTLVFNDNLEEAPNTDEPLLCYRTLDNGFKYFFIAEYGPFMGKNIWTINGAYWDIYRELFETEDIVIEAWSTIDG